MGRNRYRNKPCPCGKTVEKIVWETDIKGGTTKQIKKQVPVKFKHCCLQNHYKAQAGLITNLAKKIHEKTTKYWRKRYKAVSSKPLNEPMMGRKDA